MHPKGEKNGIDLKITTVSCSLKGTFNLVVKTCQMRELPGVVLTGGELVWDENGSMRESP